MIALDADEIVMSEHSVLGSIDPKLGDTPGSSLIKTVADKPTAKIDDRTLILADVGRKAIVQSSGRKGGADPSTICGAASAVAETLTSGTWTHDYPIWASGRTSFGVPVSTDMPDNLLEPLKLYPQPVRTQSSGGVEYLPVERRASGGSKMNAPGWTSLPQQGRSSSNAAARSTNQSI